MTTTAEEGTFCIESEFNSRQGGMDFFPSYNAAINVRTDTLKKYPGIAGAFAPVTAALSNDVLRTLNGKVDVEGEQPAAVAFNWMVKKEFISRP